MTTLERIIPLISTHIAVLVLMGVSIAMMALTDSTDGKFAIWTSLLTFATGFLIPNDVVKTAARLKSFHSNANPPKQQTPPSQDDEDSED